MGKLFTERPDGIGLRQIPFGERGLLSAYSGDVVMVVNGTPVTRADLLNNKRRRQRRHLVEKLRPTAPVVKPCFVNVFYNDTFIYGGWWCYVLMLKRSWCIMPNSYRYGDFPLKVMRLFPCDYLPMIENFEPWMENFAKIYHRPTEKRPTKNGLAIARALVSPAGDLLDLTRW